MTKPLTMTLIVLYVAASANLILSTESFAHHGWVGYDANKTLTLTGVITESSYTNPHGLIRLQVGGVGGKTWQVVLAPPARMKSRGLSQDMLRVGTTATAVGYSQRVNTDEVRAERLTIDGKTIELR